MPTLTSQTSLYFREHHIIAKANTLGDDLGGTLCIYSTANELVAYATIFMDDVGYCYRLAAAINAVEATTPATRAFEAAL